MPRDRRLALGGNGGCEPRACVRGRTDWCLLPNPTPHEKKGGEQTALLDEVGQTSRFKQDENNRTVPFPTVYAVSLVPLG